MRNKQLEIVVTVFFVGIGVCSALIGAEKKSGPIRTQKIAEAGPDYLVQGEYLGTLRSDDVPRLFGVQVIALGKGTFSAKGYYGGLPGAGWDMSEKLVYSGAWEKDGGEVVLKTDAQGGCTMKIGKKQMTIASNDGVQAGSLVRLVRESPTLGMAPPPGARVLFDGTTAEHFVQRNGKKDAEMSDGSFLQLSRGSGGLFTRKAFQSCFLHLEFRLPFEPQGRGQGRGNSGCYFQGRYEVQILDSFGLRGRENECGGMYSSGAAPAVNMCFPPLTWQTYDIEFKAAEFDKDGKKTSDAWLTVFHNGVCVYRKQKIGHTTTAAPITTESPQAMPHYLQDHGHHLLFKNVWVVER